MLPDHVFITPSSPTLISKCAVRPDRQSTLPDLKLSVFDLPLLGANYNQKGVLLARPPIASHALIPLLCRSLSETLSYFPPLAGRLTTCPSSGHVYISSNDAGADFVHATAMSVSIHDLLSPRDVPNFVRDLFRFALDGAINYSGHSNPLLAVQVTELADGVFIGCSVNHAVVDGTSFWNFFNAFAEVCKGVRRISKPPDFTRNLFQDSTAVLRFPEGAPKANFTAGESLRERIFRFSREAIMDLKARANGLQWKRTIEDTNSAAGVEIMGSRSNDGLKKELDIQSALGSKSMVPPGTDRSAEISSFQSLCALLWQSVTRARKIPPAVDTTFYLSVNCRHRIEPRIDPLYFGNAIQSAPTTASAGDISSQDLRWCAGLLNRTVVAHVDCKIRRIVAEWEREPWCIHLGNSDGTFIRMGSSPRFPVYDNDFGWGRPVAVRCGRANKFDGKITAFPGREGDGEVELEVCLSPATMSALEVDPEFLQYVMD